MKFKYFILECPVCGHIHENKCLSYYNLDIQKELIEHIYCVGPRAIYLGTSLAPTYYAYKRKQIMLELDNEHEPWPMKIIKVEEYE